MKRRLFCLLAALAISLSTAPAALADDFTPPEIEAEIAADADSTGYSPDLSDPGGDCPNSCTADIWSTKTYNRAGRPITGEATDWCQGIAYGRVNGKLVLFTAAHCYIDRGASKRTGTFVYGNNNTMKPGTYVRDRSVGTSPVIGTIGEVNWTAGVKGDLGFIYLTDGAWPSDKSRQFRDVQDGTKRWRSTTEAIPPYAMGCLGLTANGKYNNASVYQNWQKNLTTGYPNQTGTTTGWEHYTASDDCAVQTEIPQHTTNGLKDSGSGMYIGGYGDSVGFVATGVLGNVLTGPRIFMTPIRPALASLDTFYQAKNGGNALKGAWLCFTPSCPANDRTP